MNKNIMYIFSIILCGLLSCCIFTWFPSGSSELDDLAVENLFGTWYEQREVNSAEKLILANDYTFKHFFTVPGEFEHEENGTWQLIHNTNGCYYIYFKGMKYFYQDKEIAESGNRWPDGTPMGYWDECGKRRIEMLDKTILFVSKSSSYSNGIILNHMAIDRNQPDVWLYLEGSDNY